jgi:23S rRNA (pseudouridine1915-N3)-methyltransferase
MKLRVVGPVQRTPAWVSAGWDEYARRMPRAFALEFVAVRAEPRTTGRTVPQLLASEADRLRAAYRGARVIALDERGETWTTRALAGKLAQWRDEASDVAFLIGSADGLAASVKRDAAAVVALSALTLPHGLVRIIVAEQLYRAVSLIGGHPYHRE